MLESSFEWDEGKNRANQKKHGISFAEAVTAFYDDNARLVADPEHSDEEERFFLMGHSARGRLLVVVHCYRENPSVIRIISARPATKRDRNHYEEHSK